MKRLAVVVLLVVAACGDSGSDVEPVLGSGTTTPAPAPTVTMAPDPGELRGLELETVETGLGQILDIAAPRGDTRVFLAEKEGLILIHEAGELFAEPFLNIRELVGAAGLEQGLLGLAFHPAYPSNGRFFVHYSDNAGDTVIAEYRVSGDADVADADSARILFELEQPAGNHNGGQLAFGPDGYLYVALGDGGGANDQFGHGQRADTLLGTLLRLDVDSAEPYAIPPDNPFAAGEGGAPEVWAWGLRNPWRFSFDGDLIYIADVGQADLEEIDVAPADAAGLNYGWSVLEGDACFAADTCDPASFQAPALTYDHGEGCSVTGGYVYRGGLIPEIQGHYFYADWCAQWVRSFRYADGTVTDEQDWSGDFGPIGQIVTFGQDGFGELYVSVMEGTVYRLAPIR